jgi:hypothetical protein
LKVVPPNPALPLKVASPNRASPEGRLDKPSVAGKGRPIEPGAAVEMRLLRALSEYHLAVPLSERVIIA